MPIIPSSALNTLIKSYLSVNIFCKGNGGRIHMDSTLLIVGIFGIVAILAIGMFVKNTISFLKESRQSGGTYDEPAPRPQEQPRKVEPKAEVKAKPAVQVQPGRRPAPKPVAAPAAPGAESTMPTNGTAFKGAGSVANTDPKIPKAEAAQPAVSIPAPQVAAAPTATALEAAQPVVAPTEAPKPLVTDTAKNAGRPPIRVQGPKEEDSKRIERIENVLAKHFEPQPVNDNHKADKSAG